MASFNPFVLAEFAKMAEQINRGELGDNLEDQLAQLHIKFLSLRHDWILLTPMEQTDVSNRIRFYEAQANFHAIGAAFTQIILAAMDSQNPSALGRNCTNFPDGLLTKRNGSRNGSRIGNGNGNESGNGNGSGSGNGNGKGPEPAVNETIALQPPGTVEQPLIQRLDDQSVNSVIDELPSSWGDSAPTPQAPFTFQQLVPIFKPIFTLKPFINISEAAFHHMYSTIRIVKSQMEGQGGLSQREVSVIMIFLLGLLDITSLAIWSWQTEGQDPNLEEFLQFLKRRARRIHNSELGWSIAASQPSTSRGLSEANSGSLPADGVARKKKGSTTEKVTCYWCKSAQHLIHQCSAFKLLGPEVAEAYVRSQAICLNCFSISHASDRCSKGPCKKCGSKHNSILRCQHFG